MAIRLAELARSGLEEIRDYTVKTWGRPQWLTCFRHIARAFDLITENPRTGVDRSLFVPGMRSISCQKHVIFFKCLDTADGTPVVLRIVHERRHMPALVYFDGLSAV